jgi:hypothetical protein
MNVNRTIKKKEDKMDGTVARMEDITKHTKLLSQNLNGRDVDERIILKWALMKWDEKVWSELKWIKDWWRVLINTRIVMMVFIL